MAAPRSPFNSKATPVDDDRARKGLYIYKFPENDPRFKHINRKVGFGKDMTNRDMGWGLYALEELQPGEHVCLFTGHWMLHTQVDEINEVDSALYQRIENYIASWGTSTVWHHTQMSPLHKKPEKAGNDDVYRRNDELVVVPRMNIDATGLKSDKTDVFDAGAWMNGESQSGSSSTAENCDWIQCLIPDLNVCGTVNMKNAFSKSYCLSVMKAKNKIKKYEQLFTSYAWDPNNRETQSTRLHNDKGELKTHTRDEIFEFHKNGLRAWHFFKTENGVDILHPFTRLQPEEDVQTYQVVGPPVTIHKTRGKFVFVAHVRSRFPKDHIQFIRAHGEGAIPTSGFDCVRMQTECDYATCSKYVAKGRGNPRDMSDFEKSLTALFGQTSIGYYNDMFPTKHGISALPSESGSSVQEADTSISTNVLFQAFYERLRESEAYF